MNRNLVDIFAVCVSIRNVKSMYRGNICISSKAFLTLSSLKKRAVRKTSGFYDTRPQ